MLCVLLAQHQKAEITVKISTDRQFPQVAETKYGAKRRLIRLADVDLRLLDA